MLLRNYGIVSVDADFCRLFVLFDVFNRFFAHKDHECKAEGDEVGDGEDHEVIYRIPLIIRAADGYAEHNTDQLFKGEDEEYSCIRCSNRTLQQNIPLASAYH